MPPPSSRLARVIRAVLLAAVGVLLAVVVLTPSVLSSAELLDWARDPGGLHLAPPLHLGVVGALDAAAGVCVLLVVISASRGEPGGVFSVLVWVYAAGSAVANWRHAQEPGAAPDAWWFFPLMSLGGPALLEAVLFRVRRWIQHAAGRRRKLRFGRRWIPLVGATRDTFGAYRTALLLDLHEPAAALRAFHELCPSGSLRVATALRYRDLTAAFPTTWTAAPPPARLLRQVPTRGRSYATWRRIWAQLQQAGPGADLGTVAATHRVSRRTVERIRRAGDHGLLDDKLPPAFRAPTGTSGPSPAGTPTGPTEG